MKKKNKIIQSKDEIKTEGKKIDIGKISHINHKNNLEEKKNISKKQSKLNLYSSNKNNNIIPYNQRDSLKLRKYNFIKKEDNKKENKNQINKSINITSKENKKEIHKTINNIDNKRYKFEKKKKYLPELDGIYFYRFNKIRNNLNKNSEKSMNTDPNIVDKNNIKPRKEKEKKKEKEKEDILDSIRKKYIKKGIENKEKKEGKDNLLNEENKKKMKLFEEEKKMKTQTIDVPSKNGNLTCENCKTIERKKKEKIINSGSNKESSITLSLIKKHKKKSIYNSSILTNTHKSKKLIIENKNKKKNKTLNNDEKSKDTIIYYNIDKKDSFKEIKSVVNSRNKIKSTFNYLIHPVHEKTDLFKTFNQIYENYINQASKKNNINKSLTIDEKENSETIKNGLSLNDNNSSFNTITNLINEFKYEKKNKKRFKYKRINIPFKKEKLNKKIHKNTLRKLLEISPKKKSYISNNDDDIGLKKEGSINISNKIINNNTFNTTYNIYKINNIISRKELSFNRKKKPFKFPDIAKHSILNSSSNRKYCKLFINKSGVKKEENTKKININSHQRGGSFMNKPSNKYQDILINQQIIDTNRINIEIIYLLESKNKSILNKLNNYDICFNECRDWICYYFNNNIYELILNLFNNQRNKSSIGNKIKIEILCYFLCYDASFSKTFSQAGILLKTIFHLLHINFLLLITYILNNFTATNDNNEAFNCHLINNLNQIVNKELKLNLSKQEIHNENCIIEIIEQNFKQIDNYYKMIIDNLYNYSLIPSLASSPKIDKDDKNDIKIYKFPQCLLVDIDKLNTNQKLKIISLFFFDAYKLLNNYSILDLKIFFDLFLKKQMNDENTNINNNKKSQKRINTNKNKNNHEYYKSLKNNVKNNNSKYLLSQINSYYKYSLMINLDTLLYNNEYQDNININNINNKKIILRPGLVQFLQEMKQIYELILFSNNSLDYLTKILKYFEKNEKYFEYILSNNQISFDKDGSIKNIELLGRNLKNIIILDKDQSLMKANNDNIIYIKPFYGDVKNEENFLNNLTDILKKIKYDMEKINDVRISLSNHKLEIFTKISTNLI